MIQSEKAEMLDTRFAVRREADKEKRQLIEAVEKMKKKGQFSNNDLKQLGLNDIQEETNERSPRDEI